MVATCNAQTTASAKGTKQESATLISAGGDALVKPTIKIGIKIDPLNQADVKALEDAMKPYEDIVKEYNRLAGLKNSIYQTLIKAKGISMKELAQDPRITVDSINLVINRPDKK